MLRLDATLACIDLADGTRTWKGGRFGHGHLVVLPIRTSLLLSERRAARSWRPRPGHELARFKASGADL